MTIHKPARVALAAAIGFSALLPLVASAQTTTVPPLPRNNVRGGSLAARRPGGWVQSGVATTTERINQAVTNYGGVEYTQEGPEPSIRDEVLPALVDVFLDVLNQFSLLIQALLQGQTIPTTGT